MKENLNGPLTAARFDNFPSFPTFSNKNYSNFNEAFEFPFLTSNSHLSNRLASPTSHKPAMYSNECSRQSRRSLERVHGDFAAGHLRCIHENIGENMLKHSRAEINIRLFHSMRRFMAWNRVTIMRRVVWLVGPNEIFRTKTVKFSRIINKLDYSNFHAWAAPARNWKCGHGTI